MVSHVLAIATVCRGVDGSNNGLAVAGDGELTSNKARAHAQETLSESRAGFLGPTADVRLPLLNSDVAASQLELIWE